MYRQRRRILGVLLAGALIGPGFAGSADASNATTYEVTITNLTSGQPLTPPVLATHRRPVHMFQVGSESTFELKEIAENGNLEPMLTSLNSNPLVSDVEAGTVPLVPPEREDETGFPSSATFELTATQGAKYLSWASMLICTNDGFTGVDRVRLPNKVGGTVTFTTAGYDAGTEINTEDFADIVPPCQGLMGVSSGEPGTGTSNPALAEGGVIHHHEGIQGGSDLLPEVHGWTDPVARITITATN
jgi:hypothetical protein